MRTDEYGGPCPATLGEYREVCVRAATILGDPETNKAVMYLDRLIARAAQGKDELVVADDLQMRMLLVPMLLGQSNIN